jgi:hypothetical protein
MHHRINLILSEDFFKLRADTEIRQAKFCGRGDGGPVAFLQIVEAYDTVSSSKKNFGANASDVACGSRNENIQRSSLLKA